MLVEVRFGPTGLRFCGALRARSQSEISVGIPPELEHVTARPGESARLVVAVQGALYLAEARLRTQNRDCMIMALAGPVRRVQPRQARRVTCRIPVTFRVERPDGHYGAWKRGEIRDLSLGGIRISVGANTIAAQRVQVRFTLPENVSHSVYRGGPADAPAQIFGDPTIRTSTRVRYRRTSGPDQAVLGLSFTGLCANDQIMLHTFTEMMPRQRRNAA